MTIKSRKSGLPTMRDVARQAGVSATVVSCVLSGKSTGVRVSQPTAERVRQAAADLGYRLNVTAKQFRERQTLMIGVLHGIGFGRPFLHGASQYFAALMDGIIDGAFEHGYSVTLCPKLLGQSPEDAMADGRFDGLVWYSTSPSGNNKRMLEQCTVPLVLIHTPSSEFQGRFPAVTCDNHHGIGLAVEHLAGLGHRRIAFATEYLDQFGELRLRREAFFKHLRARGIEVSEHNFVNITPGEADWIHRIRESFSAVIAVHDGVAAEILEQAEQAGIGVPEELSVIGFDSTPFCLQLRPRLTSVYQPLTEMGHRAVDLLVNAMHGDPNEQMDLVYQCGLDERESTGPA